MNTITKEMQEIIEKNLPAQTAGAMSDFIKDAEETKDALAIAADKIDTLEMQKNVYEKENVQLKHSIQQQSKLTEREKKLEEQTEALRIRERDLKLEIAEIQLNAANDRNNKVEQLVEKVFGHPSVSVSTYKSKPIMVGGDNGCTPYQSGSATENENTTTTTDKI